MIKTFALILSLLPGILLANMDIITLAKQQEPYLFSIRNHLHENPETAWEEEQSLAFVKAELEKIKPAKGRKLIIKDNFEGGLVADLIVPSAEKMLLFRADIDALHVEENPSHAVVSNIKGKMHACGHDIHSAMLLAAAKVLLSDESISPTTNIRFIWQRAEENPGTDPKRYSGAFTFVKENVLEGIDEVYGIHIWAPLPSGTIFSANKAIMGTANRLKLDVYTSGGHSSSPHQGINALRVTHALMSELKEVHVRLLGPMESVSLEPTILNAGTATNAMPAEAHMWYTLRTFLEPEALSIFEANLKRLINNIANQYQAKVDVKIGPGYPVTMNNAELYQGAMPESCV